MGENLIDRLRDMGVDVDEALERRFMDDAEAYEECLLEFAQDPCMTSLCTATQKRDVNTATREIHTIKGLSDSLGMMSLMDESADMLKAFRQGRDDEAFSMLPNVRAAYDKYVDVIKESL